MRRMSSPMLIAYFPILLILVEIGTAVGGNFPLIHEVGESRIPGYISTPLFVLCTFFSFQVALLLMRKAYDMSVARHIRVLTSIIAVITVVLVGVYGYFRLEFPGVIAYKWDTIVLCCTPTGQVSGFNLILGSASAVLGIISYHIYRYLFIHAS